MTLKTRMSRESNTCRVHFFSRHMLVENNMDYIFLLPVRLLLCCVNNKQPERAYRLLQEAKAAKTEWCNVHYDCTCRVFSHVDVVGVRMFESFHEIYAWCVVPRDVLFMLNGHAPVTGGCFGWKAWP